MSAQNEERITDALAHWPAAEGIAALDGGEELTTEGSSDEEYRPYSYDHKKRSLRNRGNRILRSRNWVFTYGAKASDSDAASVTVGAALHGTTSLTFYVYRGRTVAHKVFFEVRTLFLGISYLCNLGVCSHELFVRHH